MSSARASLLRILAVTLLCAGAAALALHAGASAADVLCVAPAALLALLVAVRRYPGERALLALASRRRTAAHAPRPALAHARHRGVCALLPRGGALLAFGLAVRPPPAAPTG